MARERSANELQVIEGIPLESYYNQFIVPLSAKFTPISRERNTGLCPFHTDTDPSLHAWYKKSIFHCFGCGFGGDVIRTHMQLRKQYFNEQMDIKQATWDLARLYNITIDEEAGDTVQSPFDRAKELLLDNNRFTTTKGQMTIAEFRKMNKRVMKADVHVQAKIDNYAHMDALASTFLSNHKKAEE